jgi:protein O-GlcNAc transferase
MPEPDLLDFAIRAIKTNDLAGAEIAARLMLDDAPRDAAALHLLGIIAARVSAFDTAEDYFGRALECEPDNVQIAQNLAAAREAIRPALSAAPRYLVIREWGFGFWSDVSHVLGGLLLAEVTGRIPLTWWGRESLFSHGADGDAFQFYFQPVSNVTLQDVPDSGFFPPRWNKDNLKTTGPAKWQGRHGPVYFINRPEAVAVLDFFAAMPNVMPWLPPAHPLHGKPVEVVYRALADKYLKPRSDIVAACDAFFDQHLKGAPFVAAHLRGGDKFKEDENAQAVNEAILSALAQTDPSWRILLLTDDARCLGKAQNRFGNRVIATPCQRSGEDQGVHLLSTTNRVQAGREAMIDAYLALRAERFIGNGLSNVSAMIAVLRHWPADACILFGPSILKDRSFALYRKKTG